MKISIPQKGENGFALVMTVLFGVIGLIALGGALSWSISSSKNIDRNNEYFGTVAAAEAATEKAVAYMGSDYWNQGEGTVVANLSQYATKIPLSSESGYWDKYQFKNPQNQPGQVFITQVSGTNSIDRSGGLATIGGIYRVVANASSDTYEIQAAVSQDIQLATTPMFQFAIFYNMDMEINPGPAMTVRGRVHSNRNIYSKPGASLAFNSDVTAVSNIFLYRKPDDGVSPGSGTVIFNAEHEAGVNTINVPIKVANSSDNMRSLIEIPPGDESASSALGTNRIYNKADLILIVSNDMVVAKSGPLLSPVTVPQSEWSQFLKTNSLNSTNANVNFYNRRESLPIQITELNISNLVTWTKSASNSLSSALGGTPVDTVYIADMRPTQTTTYTTNAIITTNTAPATSDTRPASSAYVGAITTNTVSTFSVSLPSSGTYSGILLTNTSAFSTNTFPAAGTYLGGVTTNTTITNSVSLPSAGTYIGILTTNTSTTSSNSRPASGTYTGVIVTNSTSTTSSSSPSSGTYVGSITTNCNSAWVTNTSAPSSYCPGSLTQSGSGSNRRYRYHTIGTYSYGLITGYTFNRITGYTYNKVSGYTYGRVVGYTYNKFQYSYSAITGRETNLVAIANIVKFAESGVRLVRGETLPSKGLTIASPNPIYIKGDYNISTNGITFTRGSTNTANTLPAAIMADAITVLSGSWNDTNSNGSTRAAAATTINAAFMAGIVETTSGLYSGGVENFPRFLENWSGITFTYNGSMVVMFESQYATGTWGPDTSYYGAPTRNWAFDVNFLDPTKIPPATPRFRSIKRLAWKIGPAGQTSF